MSRGRKYRERKKQKPPPMLPKKHWSTLSKFFAALLAAATLVGGVAAAVALLPRVTVEVGDPMDSLNPYSTPFTISNTNIIPLERVGLAIGLCNLKITPQVVIRGPNEDCGGGSNARIALVDWQNHRLDVDEKWRVLLRDVFNITNNPFAGGDITMVVTYTPWPLSMLNFDRFFKREKQFRFKTTLISEGKYQWLPKTIDRP